MQNPAPDENSFNPPDEELQQRAELLAKRATQLLAEITPESAGVSAGVTYKAIASTQDFMQSQSCYAELSRRQDIRRADRDRKHNEKIEKRDFWMEVGVMVLIGLEIALSIYYGQRGLREGKEQGAILEQMNKNTKDTAAQIQRAADAMTAFLKIAQQQETDRLAQLAKKPILVLYAGNLPLTKLRGPLKPTNETETSATFDLVLRNDGDAAAHQIIFRVLMPRGAATTIASSGLSQNLPGYFLGDGRIVAYQWGHASLWPKTYVQISVTVSFQKGSPPFQVSFHGDTDELTTDTPLGVLTISPRKG